MYRVTRVARAATVNAVVAAAGITFGQMQTYVNMLQ